MENNTLSLSQHAIELAKDHYQSLALGFYKQGVPMSSELMQRVIPGLVLGFLIARRELSPPPTLRSRNSVGIEDGADTYWVARSYMAQLMKYLDWRSSFLINELRRDPSLDERNDEAPRETSPSDVFISWEEKSGKSMQRLADEAGTSLATVWRIRNGTSKVRIGILMDVSEAMELGKENWKQLRWPKNNL